MRTIELRLKRIGFLAFAVVLCSSAQVASVDKTSGAVNGRYWTSLDEAFKAFFLAGYLQGTFANASIQLNDGLPATVIGDMEKGLDRFYAEPENLRFPVSAALWIFAMKVEGKPQTEIDRTMARFRSAIAEDRMFRLYDVMKEYTANADNWQKSKECATQAEKIRGADGSTAELEEVFVNHYSPMYGRCFVRITHTMRHVKVGPGVDRTSSAMLMDAFEGSIGAIVAFTGPCYLAGKPADCAKAEEFISVAMTH